jgi:hypothetical protein
VWQGLADSRGARQLPKLDQAKRWSGEAKQLPRAALQFRSECKFAAADPGTAGGDGAKVPFTMTARTGDPIDHWYWGRIVHDMSGMELSKPTLPVDYCHSACEILGYADKFETQSNDLVVSGNVVPMPDDDDDRANEVIYKQGQGVPYEASIDWSGGAPVIEYVPAGASVEVNGREFVGPGVVVRQWMLRGVAICPYGADPGTNTEFAGGDKITVTAINSPKGENLMNNKPNQSSGAEAAKPGEAAGTPPPGATQQAQQAAPAQAAAGSEMKPEQKYIQAFGDVGARWFLEKKSFEDCTTEFVQQLRKSHTDELAAKDKLFAGEKAAIQGDLDKANQKLAAIGRGDAGVTFSNADGGNVDPKTTKLIQNLGPSLGRFAAGIKVPGTAAAPTK